MDLKGLIGREITIRSVNNGDRTHKSKWTVIETYKHCVVCIRTTETGEQIREAFGESELITQGVIAQARTFYYGEEIFL